MIESPLLNQATKLAEQISKFKTPEMERAFADMLLKLRNPPMMVSDRITATEIIDRMKGIM